MTDRKAISMIGLCRRAGKLASGAFQVEKAINSASARLVLADERISTVTYEKYKAACETHGIPIKKLETNELENAIGIPGRIAAAVTDDNFAQQIIKLIDGGVGN